MSVVIIFVLVFGGPITFTILNILSLMKRQPVSSIKWDIFALNFGLLYTIFYFKYAEFSDYWVAIDRISLIVPYHSPLATQHIPTLIICFLLSLVGYAVLRYNSHLSPVIAAVCFSSLLLGCVLGIVYIIQFSSNIKSIDDLLIYTPLLYPFNYILLYLHILHDRSKELANKMQENFHEYKNPILNFCAKILCKSTGWIFISFLLMFPLLCVVMIILTLLGQRPDSLVKVFTETSDWRLSQQISPPDLEHSGHYLCTVAAQGHTNIVRPIRCGVRHGKKIVVNRQLCVANAFEQILEEKCPNFHQSLRGFYDKYGYPISRFITSQFWADMVYLLMKPLEYFFLFVIYLVDEKPENRIAMQYIPR